MIRAFVCILLFTVSLSCNETNPRTIKAWIAIADTIVIRQTLTVKDSLEALCTQHSESYYRAAYDSIYQKRLGEMKLLLDSIKISETIY